MRRGRLASFVRLAVWVVVLTAGVYALRASGFRFRWEDAVPVPRAGSSGEIARRGTPHEANRYTDPLRPPEATGERHGDRMGSPESRDPAPAGVIDFETYPDGRAACESCPLSDEYGSLGVVFSFRSWTADARRPYLVDAGSYLPRDAELPHALAPALQARGLEVGVIRMEFADAPVRVAFDLTGPDLIDRFQVTAWTPRGRIESAAIPRSRPLTFDAAGGGRFRRERVTIESEAGIDRVELDGWGPPGYLMLVDNLSLFPSMRSRHDPR